jgi:alcohol dehydrogenase
VTINNSVRTLEAVRNNGGLCADVAIEAVGVPATFELATTRSGLGHVANIGVHGTPATLHLEDLWIRNVTITTGLVDATHGDIVAADGQWSARRRSPGDTPLA